MSQFLTSVIPHLPDELADGLRQLCATSNAEALLEQFLRFTAGGEPATPTTEPFRQQWQEHQPLARGTLLSLLGPSQPHVDSRKRALNEAGEAEIESKRQRLSPAADDTPMFTLHSVSATAPVRKKVDITIGSAALTFKHATSGNLESTIPLSAIKRAFLLPTRGKSKPHWTVVLLSNDTPDKGQDNPQIIFGIDATTTVPLSTTTGTTRDTLPKGSASLPSIRAFLSHLANAGVQLCEPSTDVFKSACNGIGSNASTTGIPGVEAYRAAKQGNLWFMKEGILWGEMKPCEFWAVEDLFDSVEGVRISPGSGRVFSITLTRKVRGREGEGHEDEDEGIETELGMIDAKERDVVAEWVRKHQNSFGRKVGEAPPSAEELKKQKQKAPVFAGPVTINQLAAESDSEDEDFVGSDDDDEDCGTSDSGSESGGSGADDSEAEEEGSDDGEEGENDGEEEGPLNPQRHPLMRPGAMPKMGKAAMDMVVGMVEDDLMGGEGDDGVDELDED